MNINSPKDPQANNDKEKLALSHGLSKDEYKKILDILKREPNLVELGIFSVMWSEHCSYKTTRIHLSKLPTKAPWVICGPGENAGIIDIGDDQAIVFKMESHNHPSYIEPFQGAATGVGGIMRDVFTMGARPICNLNALRFGDFNHKKTKHLLSGVVAGISSYGNCMGVPTVAGECTFHEAYNGNILVNAMTVGLVDKNNIFYSAASNIGSPVIYVGAKTGRDGIHGATMASAEFDDKSGEKRPTVQVGDPFTEKRLLEACLELMATDSILSIQDMGAAGLTCSSLEMADKGGTGIEMILDKVPVREEKMQPYEIMLSESQERMLMVIKPEKQDEAKKIFDKWEIDFAHIGTITNTGRMILKFNNEIVADLPVAPLSQMAPIYDRPHTKTPKRTEISFDSIKSKLSISEILLKLISCPDLSSKAWIYEQYDRQVMNDSLGKTGGDAAVVRIHNSNKAIAVTSDCTPRYCFADPFMGGKQAVAESYRNISATGARPLSITNCLNFASPEKPEIMGQLVGCIEGISEACKVLDYPVVSGNVSLYNETSGKSILPTPNIGGVGLLDNIDNYMDAAFKENGDEIFVIGETKGHLGSSIYLREIENKEEGSAPDVDLNTEKKHGEFVQLLTKSHLINSCHDIADGGLGIAITEMALLGKIGAEINIDTKLPLIAYLFGEDQARYIITANSKNTKEILALSHNNKMPIEKIGKVYGNKIIINNEEIELLDLKKAHSSTLPNMMNG